MIMTLDSFREKFEQYGASHPYWKIFSGRRIGGAPAEKNLEMENKDDSWEMLEKNLSWYPNGIVTVLLLTSPNAKNESAVVSTVKLDVGDVAGIGNAGATQPMNNMQQMFQMMTMMKQFATPDLAAIEARIEQKYEIKSLREQMEMGEPMTAKDRMMESMADAMPMAISGLLGIPMAPMTPAQTTSIGVAGQQEAEATPKTQAGKLKRPDLNRLASFAYLMQQLYPHVYINDLLEGFLLYAQQHKPMADQVVAQIIANANNQNSGGEKAG